MQTCQLLPILGRPRASPPGVSRGWQLPGTPSIRSRSRTFCAASKHAKPRENTQTSWKPLVEAELITPHQAANRLASVWRRPRRTPTRRRRIVTGTATALKPVGDEPKQMGPYRILRRLGQGGMGAVFLAFDPNENRQVAVKVLSWPEHAPQEHSSLQAASSLEGKNGALLTHPNISAQLRYRPGPTTPSCTTSSSRFVDGPKRPRIARPGDGPLQVGDAVHIILDIARALEYAHVNRIIHRDVKPSNILLTAAGVAKLSDMGLAKRRDDTNHLTSTSASIGTPFYMPYEQAMNAKLADERSDIYALGATLYDISSTPAEVSEVLTGEVLAGDRGKKGLGIYPPARMVIRGLPDSLEKSSPA